MIDKVFTACWFKMLTTNVDYRLSPISDNDHWVLHMIWITSLRWFQLKFNSWIFLEIWISINATNRSRNSWSGEYTLYSILKNKYPTWKRNEIILAYNDPLPEWVFTTEDSYLRNKERQSFISTFYIRTPGTDKKVRIIMNKLIQKYTNLKNYHIPGTRCPKIMNGQIEQRSKFLILKMHTSDMVKTEYLFLQHFSK